MQCIMTKYIGPTNTKGSRIKAMTGNGKNSLTIGYPHEESNPHAVAAVALAQKLGWTGALVEGETATGSVFVFTDGDMFEI